MSKRPERPAARKRASEPPKRAPLQPKRRQPERARRRLSPRARRILPVAVLALVAFLYYKPIKAYEHTKSELTQRRDEVAALRARNERLQATLGSVDNGPTLVREARLLGLVRPGERLFIVKGIDGWRAARAKAGSRG